MNRLHMFGLALAAILLSGKGHAEELTGTLKKVKETGVITLGYRDSSIPFSYLDDNQKPIGFAIDICSRIVDAVKNELKLDKLAVEFNSVTSSTRIPLLANGTIDLECGSTTNNAERQKQVWFTNTHFLTATRFVSTWRPSGRSARGRAASRSSFRSTRTRRASSPTSAGASSWRSARAFAPKTCSTRAARPTSRRASAPRDHG